MATQVQTRRGSTAQHASFTGAAGEITVDTDKNVVVVHDGSTAGGIPLAKEASLTTASSLASGAYDKANSANVLAYNTGIGANAYAGVMANAANAYASSLTPDLTAANNWANTKVASVTGTSGQIYSSGGTTPTLNLISTGVSATTYGGSTNIPVVVIDEYGRVTSASNVAVNGMDYAYVNSSTAAANTWANNKVDTITSNSTSRIWANSVVTSGIETVYLDLATSGVTATTYGGSTAIPAITIDAYGRVTSASNVSVSAGITLTNETGSSSTYYPMLTTATSGSQSVANTSSTKLYFTPSSGTLSATLFNSLSDITLKEEVASFEGMELLNNITPVTFKWKDTGVKSYGTIAQELEKTMPELVDTNDDGLKSVSYIPMIAILIDVVKKQQKQIDYLINKLGEN